MKFTTEEFNAFKKAAMIYRAINHPLRQKIYEFLCVKERDVTSIYTHFLIEQSVASQHLAILRKSGWVKTRREGKWIYYAPNTEKANQYKKSTSGIV